MDLSIYSAESNFPADDLDRFCLEFLFFYLKQDLNKSTTMETADSDWYDRLSGIDPN